MVAPNAGRDVQIQDFKRSFDIKYATQLADALEVPPGQLLGDE